MDEWLWLSFDRYEITDGIVHPAEGAEMLQRYDPWLGYHRPGRRRRDRSAGEQEEKTRTSRPQQPYDDLLRLGREMEVWPDDDVGGRVRDQTRLPAGLKKEVLNWCKHHGLLGLLHHRATDLRLRPLWERGPRAPSLHAVVHGWTRMEGRWQEVARHYAGVTEKTLDLEGKPVSSARYPELQLAEQRRLARRDPSLPRPVFDLLGPEGGLLRHPEYGEAGAMLVPFGDEWDAYFPNRPSWRPPTWPFPSPDDVGFMRGYGEPLSAIVDTAAEFCRILSLVAYHSPRRRPPSRSQRQRIVAAIGALEALAGPPDEVIELDEEGRPVEGRRSRSLLGAYCAMIMLDLKGGDPVRICKRKACRVPFIYPDSRTKHCRDQCRRAEEQAEYRREHPKRK